MGQAAAGLLRPCRFLRWLPVGLLLLAGQAHAQRLTMTPALMRDSDPSKAAPQFSARVGTWQLDGDVFGIFAMPGEMLSITAQALPAGADMTLDGNGFGAARRHGGQSWRWRTPQQPGLYPIALRNRATGGQMRLNVFVKTPFNPRTRQINGYVIGRYEPTARRNDPGSAAPRGLAEATPASKDVHVSPHFTLGDFLCHQQPQHWPKYLLIRPRLLAKLEMIRSALIDAGVDGNGLVVMSAYRTPWYNADIGNTTVYSQHLFGSAADIFMDADRDGAMDDLNADGAVTLADAQWLADLVGKITARSPDLAGGLSAYPGNAQHGPFVHVDVRGVAVRW